jgi:hypothetical protein
LIESDILIRVELPWACFGLIARAGVVVETAPISKWAVGKQARETIAYWQNRGAKVTYLEDEAWKSVPKLRAPLSPHDPC